MLIWIFAACAHKLISPFKNACKTLSVTFGDSSPRGRAKGAAGNCAICHISIKKRSESAPIRSVNCLTNAPLAGQFIGSKVGKNLDAEKLNQFIYIMVLLSGINTLVKYIR